ncbi:MAG: hypothetical protein LQ340_002205 [Diploschistes diacapsis]|nr:MAG: hypothetical protein LQ340_002205 [Diploschistes diacapsis]
MHQDHPLSPGTVSTLACWLVDLGQGAQKEDPVTQENQYLQEANLEANGSKTHLTGGQTDTPWHLVCDAAKLGSTEYEGRHWFLPGPTNAIMQLQTILLTALAGSAAAFPLSDLFPRAAVWTIESFTRTCDTAETSCNYSYSINLNDGSAVTKCIYNVPNSDSTPANDASYALQCGDFAISSGWSGQFGPGNGFSTLAVKTNNQIIYPAYSDAELVNGTAVQPDKSYTPQAVQQAVLIAS